MLTAFELDSLRSSAQFMLAITCSFYESRFHALLRNRPRKAASPRQNLLSHKLAVG
jgi:hypothetical protein